MKKEAIKSIENSFCYFNSEGGLFLVSNYRCKYFDNLNRALEETRENIIDLFIEKEVFFKSLTDLSSQKMDSILKNIKEFSYLMTANEDFSYFFRKNTDNFFRILRDIEAIKWEYRQEQNPNVLQIIDCRNQLISLYVQIDKLIEIKKINQSFSKKISSDLFRCSQELSRAKPNQKISPATGYFLEERINRFKLYLNEVIFVNPYKERFDSLKEFLETLESGPIEKYTSIYLMQKVTEINEKFSFNLQLH